MISWQETHSALLVKFELQKWKFAYIWLLYFVCIFLIKIVKFFFGYYPSLSSHFHPLPYWTECMKCVWLILGFLAVFTLTVIYTLLIKKYIHSTIKVYLFSYSDLQTILCVWYVNMNKNWRAGIHSSGEVMGTWPIMKQLQSALTAINKEYVSNVKLSWNNPVCPPP